MAKIPLIHRLIKNRKKILEIAKKHGIENIRIFGSVSRGQERGDSDIDLLVDIGKKPDGSRGNHISFALELETLYKKKRADVCTVKTLHPKFKEKVLKNAISIMEDDPKFDKNEKDERDLTANIDKAKKSIKEYWKIISLGKKEFLNNRTIQSSSSREMQIAVEELVRSIPDDIKKKIEDINWLELKKFRNFLVHHYDNVEWESMWETGQEKIKEAEKACERVLEVLKEDKKEK